MEPKGEPKDTSTTDVIAESSIGNRFAIPLCEVLIGALRANGSRVPAKTPPKWIDAARLLVDRDGRDPHEARELILWAANDISFWQANILSLPKFREKYDQLRLSRQRTGTPARATVRENAMTVHEELARREAARRQAEDRGITE